MNEKARTEGAKADEKFHKEQATAAAAEAKDEAKADAESPASVKKRLDAEFAARQAAEAARADEAHSRPMVDERELPEAKD